MGTIDAARLRELLHYDPETGIFTWRATGQKAGSINDRGYVRITIDGSSYRAHRLAILYVTGEMPTGQVDHVNRDRSDNRYSNLRLASHGDNRANSVSSRAPASGYRGVYWAKHVGRWRAEMTLKIGGRRVKKVLGYFDDPALAAELRDLAGRMIWGDFYKPSLEQ